jgi:hypothetical protein
MTAARLAVIGQRVVRLVDSGRALTRDEGMEVLHLCAELLNACHFMGVHLSDLQPRLDAYERLAATVEARARDEEDEVEWSTFDLTGWPEHLTPCTKPRPLLPVLVNEARLEDALRELRRLPR